jgi:hypothetical protein
MVAGAARRGLRLGMAWGRGESRAALYTCELGWRRVTTGRYLPCYGASTGARTVGAADGPGVRRAHGARTAAWRRGSRRPGAERASGGVDLGQRTASGWGVVGKARRHGRRGSAGAGRRRRGALAPDLTQFVGPTFEIEFLQNFEYNSTKLWIRKLQI